MLLTGDHAPFWSTPGNVELADLVNRVLAGVDTPSALAAPAVAQAARGSIS